MERLMATNQFLQVNKVFYVEDKPDIKFISGTDKGKFFLPCKAVIGYHWMASEERLDPDYYGLADSGPSWSAQVWGRRRLRNGFGVELFMDYKPWSSSTDVRPEWLIDLVRAYGPEGWTYQAHW